MRHTRFHQPAVLLLALATLAGLYQAAGLAQGRSSDSDVAARLRPTSHPVLPGDPGQYLFVPASSSTVNGLAPTADKLARGIRLIDRGAYAEALPLLTDRAFESTPLFAYARYYAATAFDRLGRVDEADATLISAAASTPAGLLDQAIPLMRAELAMKRGDAGTAVAVLESILLGRTADPALVLVRLGAAAEAAGDTDKALRAYRRAYFEFPLASESATATASLTRLQEGRTAPSELLPLERERAETLFAARRWSDARTGFSRVARLATRDDEKDLAELRMLQCDVQLGRGRGARAGLAKFLNGPRRAEARYFDLLITKATGSRPAFVAQARKFAEDFPDSAWTEEVLDLLATSLIVADDDAGADRVFRQMLASFPQGRHAERAGWKVGWGAYRAGRFAEAATVFDAAAANAPRADYRPSWLYWSARAYEQIGNQATAGERYRLTATDYFNSYYGRLAVRRMAARREPVAVQSVVVQPDSMPSPLIPSSLLVRELVGLGLHDEALRELGYAERVWGRSSAVEATAAWIRHHKAGQLVAMERFQHLRGAINQMKRAYPHYLAAGGETLPPQVLKIIFPLDYWPLIKSHSDQRGLDPYLMAALVAQESTFTADIRSSANAYGLMQLIPATGRRYAAKVGLRPFSVATLKKPEANVLLGMTYFKELIDRFGGAHLALASYNAGEHRVARWLMERPDLPEDEFIDDIPFPETQAYVKRIIGTAEDYRRLYGGGVLTPGLEFASTQAAPRAVTAASRAAAPARVVAPARRPASQAPSRATRTTRAR
jgi:soluble lytic murein transglycosylase